MLHFQSTNENTFKLKDGKFKEAEKRREKSDAAKTIIQPKNLLSDLQYHS